MAGMLVGGPYDGDPMKLVNPITGVPIMPGEHFIVSQSVAF